MFFKVLYSIEQLKKRIENDLLFFTLGIYLPFSLFVYKTVFILQNKPQTFEVSFFYFGVFNIWGIVLFCYLPTLFIFLIFFSKKDGLFFRKLFLKCNILFLLYSKMAKIEAYFYDNKITGTLIYILYLFCHIFSLYKGSILQIIFINSRLLIGSYFAFRRFFYLEYQNQNSYYMEKSVFLSFFHSFSQLSVKLNEKTDNKENEQHNNDLTIAKTWYSTLYAIFFLCLHKKNSNVQLEMEKIENLCDMCLVSLERSNVEKDLKHLYVEKEQIFISNISQSFFFFASLDIFGSVIKRCQLFLEKINTLN